MMWLYLIIISIIITGFFMAAMGLKMFFDKNASVAGQSCDLDTNSTDENAACAHCKVKELADCKVQPKPD
jgi:hypothetical protein